MAGSYDLIIPNTSRVALYTMPPLSPDFTEQVVFPRPVVVTALPLTFPVTVALRDKRVPVSFLFVSFSTASSTEKRQMWTRSFHTV